ncbi:MAG: hypothetical protein ACI8P9_001514 [Parasphingorhabdus sp.]|jgi:hypothetical protein
MILLLPMFGWSITGIVFFVKPGYSDAYQQLALKTYPLDQLRAIEPNSEWLEVRAMKTLLGNHLLVRKDGLSLHLEPQTLSIRTRPNDVEMAKLLNDAISFNPVRYGNVIEVSGNVARTSTGVELKLNWDNLQLSQRGRDTELIDTLYKIHYLQWSPNKTVNQLLGIFGLVLLICMSVLGCLLLFRGRRTNATLKPEQPKTHY